jgi:phosphoribosylglycinamide formyltransferase 2
MVTLAGTQNLSEFELHARAILGLPILEVKLEKNGASAVILADESSEHFPVISGIENALTTPQSDIRIFGKPTTRKYRRMGVTLVSGSEEVDFYIAAAKEMASKVKIN